MSNPNKLIQSLAMRGHIVLSHSRLLVLCAISEGRPKNLKEMAAASGLSLMGARNAAEDLGLLGLASMRIRFHAARCVVATCLFIPADEL